MVYENIPKTSKLTAILIPNVAMMTNCTQNNANVHNLFENFIKNSFRLESPFVNIRVLV